jgi:hypothetical protein
MKGSLKFNAVASVEKVNCNGGTKFLGISKCGSAIIALRIGEHPAIVV